MDYGEVISESSIFSFLNDFCDC